METSLINSRIVGRVCSYCGKEFTLFACHTKRKNYNSGSFCSRECSDKGRKQRPLTLVEIVCPRCCKISKWRKGQERQFCSSICANESRRGAATERKRDPRHSKWAAAVKLRDGKCLRCEETNSEILQAHHVLPFAENPDFRYDIDNGETLCQKCHSKEHPQWSSLIQSRGKIGEPMLCYWCEVKFKKKSSLRKGKRKFCSKKCSSAWIGATQGGRIEIKEPSHGK